MSIVLITVVIFFQINSLLPLITRKQNLEEIRLSLEAFLYRNTFTHVCIKKTG
jgi:hypothetical protein